MRRSFFLLGAVALSLACSDTPTAPSLQPDEAKFSFTGSYPPPPWAEVEGDVNGQSYTAWLFVNKPGNVAWLAFQGGVGVSFSQNARIMSSNGNVSGHGTATIAGQTYQLSDVTSFEYNGDCTSPSVEGRPSCASFSGGGLNSSFSSWTGRLANSGGNGKPGDGGGGDACIPDASGECFIGAFSGKKR